MHREARKLEIVGQLRHAIDPFPEGAVESMHENDDFAFFRGTSAQVVGYRPAERRRPIKTGQ